jgi:uncharacterized membrane protein
MALIKDPTAFWKAVKEFLRIVVIAAVSAALAGATVFVGFLDPLAGAVLGAVLTTIGKAWDKYVHESEATKATGIVPF